MGTRVGMAAPPADEATAVLGIRMLFGSPRHHGLESSRLLCDSQGTPACLLCRTRVLCWSRLMDNSKE